MRNVLATDIKNNIRSIRFILGIFLIVSAISNDNSVMY